MAVTPKDTAWFQASRFGMFIHWGLYAVPARHEWVKKHERLEEATYARYFHHFDPDLYDPRLWARRAREAGMRYAVITTKHHEGFCLWDTAHTDYKATNTPAGRDLLREFVDAFRAEGLRIGFYYSLLDWNHPHYTIDRMHPRSPRGTQADFDAANAGRDMRVYARYMRDQVRELLTNYGRIDVLWCDFSFGAKWPGDPLEWYDVSHGYGPGKGRQDWESEQLAALVAELQPHCLVNNRLDLPGAGDFATPEQVQPDKPLTDDAGNPIPWEACQTFSGSWGYHRDEQTWKPVKMLLWMLIDGVSKGGNLLLNVGPTARGEFDQRACERLDRIGAWMRHHARAIHGCGPAPAGLVPPPDCRYTYDAARHRLHVHVFQWPFGALHLNGLGDRVELARLLHDGSEVKFRDRDLAADGKPGRVWGNCMLELPVVQPDVEVPVIELILKPSRP